jgi:hypothetical protein
MYFLFLRSPIVLLTSGFGRFEPPTNCCIGIVLDAFTVAIGGKGAELDPGTGPGKAAGTGIDVALEDGGVGSGGGLGRMCFNLLFL